MKKIIALTLILASFKAFPCGGGYGLDSYFFYNIFEQTNINSRSYIPFLRDGYNTFYSGVDGQLELDTRSGNIKLWKDILPGWSPEGIEAALYAESDNDFQSSWSGKKQGSEKRYMQFARRCSNLLEFRYSWNYEEILNRKQQDISDLLSTGLDLRKAVNNKQLSLRYSYQIIRILHYSNQYQEAIDYFNSNVKGQFDQDEMYWYTYDQVAGCYYSIGEYDRAAYMFLQVFENSQDRKPSAYLSYGFCVNKGYEGQSYFQGTKDQVTYITLKSLRGFSDEIAGLKELYQVSPKSSKMELLFMRAVNNFERELWPTYNGIKDDVLPEVDDRDMATIKELQGIANEMIGMSTPRKKAFWQLADSYLTFLTGDISQAQAKLEPISGSRKFQRQKEIFADIYTVFSWNAIGEQEEMTLSAIMEKAEKTKNYYDNIPAWKFLILDHVGHLYYRNEKLAKSFLIHNQFGSTVDVASLDLIEDLIEYESKPSKNSFEQKYITDNSISDNTKLDYLKYVKGHYYLQQGDPESALPLLEGNSFDQRGYGLSQYVSAFVFSNNTQECFSCSTTRIMVDSVFLAGIYDFIEPEFSKASLAKNLLQLEEMTTDEKEWKRKLAHYLLGNYYYNVSTSGYFRGTLTGEDNCCEYNFFPYHRNERTAEQYIENREGYNLYNVVGIARKNFDLADLAYDHYEQVLSYSTDKELNARVLYMMAKCELDNMYQKYNYWEYEGQVGEKELPYKQSFEKLSQEYADTKFYNKIYRECYFFREYVGY